MKSFPLILVAAIVILSCNQADDKKAAPDPAKSDTAASASEITVPDGFKIATIVESLGSNRHIVVNTNGDIYVKLAGLKDGKGIVVLRDEDKDGKYTVAQTFGDFKGTGIAIHDGYLYASSDEEVFRFKLNGTEVADPSKPERVVTGLVSKGQHASKSLALDNSGNIYVTIGAPSNACQVKDRTAGSPGQDPCPILETAGGIWQFKADGKDQSYGQGSRYATGLRNVVGLDWNTEQNQLYAMQHGRDMLNTIQPGTYDDAESAELPAEELFLIKKGGDYGWPYCYYDPIQKKKVLGPEYGGDGVKQDRCAGKEQPLYGFPAHWAPNALLFYTGSMFPAKYKNGAFIAFHGSWNRAPKPQAGYCVVFVPFKDGKPSGEYEMFANGFIGKDSIKGPDEARYRPCGLAQGPDGALYISDDKEGRIWKVTY